MRNLTLLLLILVVCAVAFSKSPRKRRSLSTEEAAEFKRMLEDIDAGNAGKVDLDQLFKESPEPASRILFRWRWPWRFGKK